MAGFWAVIHGAKYYECDTTTGCSSSAFYTAFFSYASSANSNQGTFIFRGVSDDNCFDIREISPTNTTFYPTLTVITSTSTPQAISDISVDAKVYVDN